MSSIICPVLHSCGYKLTQITFTQMVDVTSISDVPEHMRPRFFPGLGYIGGVPFDQLPPVYHKFAPVSPPKIWWEDNGEIVTLCPNCSQPLETQDVTTIISS